MERRFLAWVPAAAAFMAAILLLDRDGLAPQLALGMATAVFLAFFVRSLDLDPRPILWCVVVASTGEVVLSLGWGLYAYHHALIPLYVPPGHGLIFAASILASREPFVVRRARAFSLGVLALAAAWVAIGLVRAPRDWHGAFQSETYDGARHGWTVPGRPVYNELQAERAFEKLVELFDATLK